MELFVKKIITPKIYIPFGLEIELEGVDYDNGKRVINHKIPKSWEIKTDDSLDNKGIEIASGVIENTKENVIMLKKLSETLKYLGATFEHASLQINLDAYDLSDDDILNLFKLYSVYENIVYRFSLGSDDKLRESILMYARPIQKMFYSKYYSNVRKVDQYRRFIRTKTFGICLKTKTKSDNDKIRVVEFRTPNGSDDYRLWLNYITFFSSLLSYVKRDCDTEFIDYKFEHLNFIPFHDMTKIDEKNALELSDLIFRDEVDAGNFKEQYFAVNRKLI